MPYSPKTLLQPVTKKDDNLDELIRFLQNNIQSSMQLEQYQQGQEARKAEETYKGLLINNPKVLGYNVSSDEAQQYKDLAVPDILRAYNLRANKEKEQQDLASDADFNNRLTNFTVDENEKPTNNFRDFIKKTFSYGLTYKDVKDIWLEKQRERRFQQGLVSQNSGKEEPQINMTEGQSYAINFKQTMRKNGINYGSYVVRAYGTDKDPQMEIIDNNKRYRKTNKGIYILDGNKWEEITRDKYDVEKYKYIVESLNSAYSDWNRTNIRSKGKDVFEERFYQ